MGVEEEIHCVDLKDSVMVERRVVVERDKVMGCWSRNSREIRGVRPQGEIRFAVVLPRRADATRLRSHIDVIKWQ